MNTRSGACGTGCRSARRWHGPIGAARIATYLHARFPMLNLDNMVHNALDTTIINSVHHQQFSSPGTSRAPRAGAFDAQVPRASHTLPPDRESPRATPHALPFAPLIALQLVQLVAQHFASDVHENSRVAQDREFGSRTERVAAALKPPLHVPCGNAATMRRRRPGAGPIDSTPFLTVKRKSEPKVFCRPEKKIGLQGGQVAISFVFLNFFR